MARLDRSRGRVLCDGYRYCGQVLAIVQEEPLAGGRVLFLEPGWRRDPERVWRYREPRRPAPERLVDGRKGRALYPAPLLGPLTPQWIACPSPRCAGREPQRLDAEALDVLPLHDISARDIPLRSVRAKR